MPQAAPVISAIAAVGGLALGTVQGIEASKARRKGAREQQKAQQQASAAALSQQNQAAQAEKRARGKQPDILAILGANTGPKNPATLLTGPFGLGGGTTSLGR